MKMKKENSNRDFSIVFNEIEKYNIEDSSITENLVNEELLIQDESIREFSDICNEISTTSKDSSIFMTFC